MEVQIIKNKKAMSSLIIGLISVLLAFMIFVFAFPNIVGNLSDQTKTKMSISKFLPNKLPISKEPITKQASDYSFKIVERILDNSFDPSKPSKPPLKGSFLFVRREVLDDDYLIGFVDFGEGYKLYLSPDSEHLFSPNDLDSLKKNSGAYFDAALFDNELDRKRMHSLLENKVFVVMSREDRNDVDDVALFLNYITGLPLKRKSAIKLKEYTTFEDLLKKHTVKSLAFSTGKTTNLYWNDFKDKQTNDKISVKNKDYVLIYRYYDSDSDLDYVVFFPMDNSRSLGTEFDNKDNFKIYGKGHVNKDIFLDLEQQKMIIKIE